MHKVKKYILLAFLTFCTFPISAQIHRVYVGEHQKEKEIVVYDWNYVDEAPEFPGGERGMMEFINETRRYPLEAYNNRIQGRVMCSFIVFPDGTINEISVIKGVEESLDQEAVRIIREMPRWKAGLLGNNTVPVSCFLTIPFRL